MLAPPNARIQAILPSYSIYGRSRLRPTLAKRPLRAGNGPTIVRGWLFASPQKLPPPQDSFYNRVTELDYFREKFNSEVGLVTVLVGPRNCGKSRLLDELLQQYEAGGNGPLFLYIDSRLTPVQSPDEISKTLSNALEPTKLQRLKQYIGPDLFKSILSSLDIKFSWFTFGVEARLSKALRMDEANLNPTIKKFDKILNALKPLPRKPVIVIDEANELMFWKESDPSNPNLKKLINFLVSISKQKRLAHVVLATSDYFLASWLSGVGMTEDKFNVIVLGDLTEEEAQNFVYGNGAAGGWLGIINDLSEKKEMLAEAETQWPAIYDRCGGNIQLLKQCVAEASLGGNWDSGLEAVVAGPLKAIRQGFEPEVYPEKGGEAPLWTKDQWKMVLECITTVDHHAVLASKLKNKLGNGSDKEGSKILLSMVKYNLLALRPPSTLARDLPQEVYGKRKAPVVTLPLPAHVWAAKVVLEDLSEEKATEVSKI